jgi:hypothetical protein
MRLSDIVFLHIIVKGNIDSRHDREWKKIPASVDFVANAVTVPADYEVETHAWMVVNDHPLCP